MSKQRFHTDKGEELRKGRRGFRGKMSTRVISNKKDKGRHRRAYSPFDDSMEYHESFA